MTISSLDNLVSAATSDQVYGTTFRKAGTTAITGNPMSLWRVGDLPAAGGDGAAGSGTPGAGGTALTSADGSLSMGWANQDPSTKLLTDFSIRATNNGVFVLVDRLVSVSGISLTSTGNKNVGSAALPRYTSGKGVQAFLEVTTALTTTAAVVTMNSYTDQDGNTGSSGASVTFPSSTTAVNNLVRLPLASGDYGIRTCLTVNVGTSAATGACNFILVYELARVPVTAAEGRAFSALAELQRLPRIYDGASLMIYYIPSTTTAQTVDGYVASVYG